MLTQPWAAAPGSVSIDLAFVSTQNAPGAALIIGTPGGGSREEGEGDKKG